MPSSTFAVPAPDSAGVTSVVTGSPGLAPGTSSKTNRLRPRSAKSTRPTSPLLSRWSRHMGKENQHPFHQLNAAEHSGRKSTSSSYMSSSTGAATMTQPPPPPPTTDSSKRRDSRSGLPPPLTVEEFEALPMAIQRKYFSTLERLRFAQTSGAVDGIFDHYCQNSRRRRPRQERSVSDHLASRIRRRSIRDSHSLLNPESLAFASSLPDKIKRRQFTREEQVVLARHLRASVILDAADEAVYKVGRRASKQYSQEPATTDSSSSGILFSYPSMESLRSDRHVAHERAATGRPEAPASEASAAVPESFYDSFRWLDEEDDLDLRLFLDDYHANLREALPCPSEDRRPSFRRHLSITKIPFGRSSLSASRPTTKDASATPASPIYNPPASAGNGMPMTRRRSRTMSLITSKHPQQDLVPTIDPAAAHYQDPEARLKLRVYLASPQKFDEAIEFGFPSAEALSASPVINKGPPFAQKRQSRQSPSEDSGRMETFFADDDDDDDKISNSDQVSMLDPDSPKTPHSMEKPAIRPTKLPTYPNHAQKPSEASYAQVPASSREMTLRMTLTRPDLRAHEDQIYGWQQQQRFGQQNQSQPHQQHLMRKSQSAILRDDMSPPVYVGAGGGFGDSSRKESIEKTLAGFDHWGPEPDGVMKRFWNRVRRS